MNLKQFLNVWRDLFMNNEKKLVFDAIEVRHFVLKILASDQTVRQILL